MKYLISAFSLICCLLYFKPAFSQKIFTLQEVIELAKQNSLGARQAENRKENRYWQYNRFLSNYRPQLLLEGQLPDFNRTISPITLPDGSEQFVARSFAQSDLALRAQQVISATGGRVFVSSQLQRIDLFNSNNVSYAADPLVIGFVQPIFDFNFWKWDKKIEPLQYEESIKQYNEEFEQIAQVASDFYFKLLLAQVSKDIASINRVNNDTIYRIGQGRYQLGKIAENELLQLEFNLVNSQQQVRQAELDLETAMLNLNTFIGNPENRTIIIEEPTNIPEFEINIELAIEQAKENRQQYLQFKRERLEAQRDVAEARGNSGLNINLSGRFGLTQQSNNLPDLYNNLQDQQRVTLGLQIPIIDWGRQKAAIRTALANEELVKSTIEQEEINFEQEIYVLIKQFDILREQLKAAIIADRVAQKRYNISQQRYLVAKISITDLNIALQDKDEAKRKYLESLAAFWDAYYTIRVLTLYDFERNEKIAY